MRLVLWMLSSYVLARMAWWALVRAARRNPGLDRWLGSRTLKVTREIQRLLQGAARRLRR